MTNLEPPKPSFSVLVRTIEELIVARGGDKPEPGWVLVVDQVTGKKIAHEFVTTDSKAYASLEQMYELLKKSAVVN